MDDWKGDGQVFGTHEKIRKGVCERWENSGTTTRAL